MPVWINPLLLLGAAAAAVPVILHLVMRKRTQVIPFSRLIFMSELQRRSEHHFRLKQLLLLLMRIACLVLLAMAFARPYFKNKADAPSESTPQALFVMLDVSGSMAYQDRLQTAIEKTTSRIEDLNPGDLVGVALFDNTPRLMTSLTEDRGGTIFLLKKDAECSYERTNIASALQFGSDMLADVQNRKCTLLLVSDLQQKGLQRIEENWSLPPGITLNLISVGGDARNSCVADIAIIDNDLSDAEATESQTVRALIAHYAPSGNAKLTVSLEINDETIKTQTVTVGAGQQRMVDFSLPKITETAKGCVRLAKDDLARDDLRRFVITTNKRKQVAVLVNATDTQHKEAMFPAAALNAGDPPLYDVSFVSTDELARQKMRNLPLIIVPGEVDLDETSTEFLRKYATEGGTVFLAADKKPSEAFVHHASLTDVEAIGWLQCDRDAVVFQMFADYDVRHPVFAPFRSSRLGNFTAADFTGHERINPGPTANVLAVFDDGSPALVERRTGRGRILFFTSSLGPKWNNLPYRGLYVAFMQSIARFASSDTELPNSYLVGANALLWGASGESASVRRPDGKDTPVTFNENGDAFYSQTDLPGIYKLATSEPFSFAVNMDPEESNLESLPEEDLRFLITPAQEETPAKFAGITGQDSDDDSGQSAIYWKYLLVILLVLALGETLLANRTYR